MSMPKQRQRAEYALELLDRLDSCQETIERLTGSLACSPEEARAEAREDEMERMQGKIARYRELVAEVTQHHEAMTNAVGDWLSFIHDPTSRRHTLFPLRLASRRRRTRAVIRSRQADIAAVGLKSRLLQDEITRMEYGIRMEAIRRIQGSGDWQAHQQALEERGEILRRLGYLLPTITGFERSRLDPSNLTDLARALSTVQDID